MSSISRILGIPNPIPQKMSLRELFRVDQFTGSVERGTASLDGFLPKENQQLYSTMKKIYMHAGESISIPECLI